MKENTVTLRAIEPEDLDLLYRIENDSQLWNAGVTNVPYSRYTLHDYIANAAADIYTDRQVRLIIEDAHHHAIGLADLVNFDPQHNRAEIGLVIEQPFRHKGLAKATLQRLHHYAMHTLHLHQLYAIIDTQNSPAMTLFQNAGYNLTATLSDWLFDGHEYRHAALMQKVLVYGDAT